MNFQYSIINQGLEVVLKEGYKTSVDINNCAFSVNMLPNSYNKIKISDKIFEDIIFIKQTIDAQKTKGSLIELPFVMLGFENEPENIYSDVIIDKVEFDYDSFEKSIQTKNECSAKYEGYLTDVIDDYIKNSRHKKPVIIVGHTHPSAMKKGIPNIITNCQSFSDMEQCFVLAQQIDNINKKTNKNIQIATMVINSDGDFNSIFYDSSQNAFYKIPEIKLGEIKLPAFSSGKYIVNEENIYEQ